MGFQGDTIIALIPLVPQQKRGTTSPLSLPFAPAPPLGQKLTEMDSPDFSPARMVQDRIPHCMKQDYCGMHTLRFSTCGFLLQTTKKSLSKKIGFETTKGLDVYLSECPSFSSSRKLAMLGFHRQCKTSQVWWHNHGIFHLVYERFFFQNGSVCNNIDLTEIKSSWTPQRPPLYQSIKHAWDCPLALRLHST